jgi:NADP-dependent 3-hydroxy acid dehydrogenase YdfG
VPTLVVFGGRNLGRSIARHFLGESWRAAVVARSAETIDSLTAELPGSLGIVADAAEPGEVERAFAEAQSQLGPPELVVNALAHGGGIAGGPLAEAGEDGLDVYLTEVLPAAFHVLRIGARELTALGTGTLVQITGGSARRANPERGSWAAAAFATRALVQAAASELREYGVHAALLIVDGVIESPKTAARLEGRPRESTLAQEDVVDAVAYLAGQSPRAWTHELVLTPSRERWTP